MSNLTPKQREAVEIRDKNIIVSAAAGSGKTSVLIKRIIGLMEDGCDIDTFLVVTFTNAAAEEMKKRLKNAILEKIASGINTVFWNKQKKLLKKSSIGTMHSFCINIVKEDFYTIGLDPDVRVGNNVELEMIQDKAVEKLLKEEYDGNSDGFLNLVKCYSKDRMDGYIRELVISLYKFSRSNPEPVEWLENCRNSYKNSEITKSAWYEVIKNEIIRILGEFSHAIKNADEYDRLSGENHKAVIGTLKTIIEKLYGETGSLQDYAKTYNSIRLPKLPNRKKNVEDETLELLKNAMEIYEEFSPLCGKIIGNIEEHTAKASVHMAYLIELVKKYGAAYSDAKLEKGIIDFNDMEHFAISILKNNETASKYREKYNYIFVDEYQDTNAVQEAIVNFIKRENNLFMVGDVKQSIYKFRLADPSIFMRNYENYLNEGASGVIDLDTNFRSHPAILEFINIVMKELMTGNESEIVYDNRHSLKAGLSGGESKEEPLVEINIIKRNSAEENIDKSEEEALFISEKIKELLNTTIHDSKLKEERNVEYRDIVILKRSLTKAAEFESILKSKGIPVYSGGGISFYEAMEIRLIVNLLKLINNPFDDLALLSVMRSFIGNISDNELAKIRMEYDAVNRESREPFYSAVEYYMETTAGDNDLIKNKITGLYKKIDGWRSILTNITVKELIENIIYDTGYLSYWALGDSFSEKKSSISEFINKADNTEYKGSSGLYRFLEMVKKVKKSEIKETLETEIDENTVRIMTIHKSKGLEFPIVILSGAGNKFNQNDQKEPVLFHREIGVGFEHIDYERRIKGESAIRKAIKIKIKNEAKAEEMRVLYVALTRAEYKLIIFGSESKPDEKLEKWKEQPEVSYMKMNSYLDWIGKGITSNCALKNSGDNCYAGTYSGMYSISVNVLNGTSEELDEVTEKPNDTTAAGSTICDTLSGLIGNIYFPEKTLDVPSKISVTQIKSLSGKNDFTEIYNIEKTIIPCDSIFKEEAMDSKKRGTLFHLVMEKIDFNSISNEKSLDEQIKLLHERGFIKAEELQDIDKKGIMEFINSDIGMRLANASEIYKEVPFCILKPACELVDAVLCSEKVMIQGIIDCYFTEGDEIILLDYKTDAIFKDIENEAKKRYKVQMELYKEALEITTGKIVKESHIYFVKSGRDVIV